MHAMTCQCPKCRGGASAEFEAFEFEISPQGEFEDADEESYEYETQNEGEDAYELGDEFEYENGDEHEDEASFGSRDAENPFSEEEEAELAMELLSVSGDEELDQFLGKLFKRAWRGVRKVGKAVGKIARPLGGVLKGLAKKALPFVGGALGSFIPIPGVGTALGTALGSAVGKALEAEFGELEVDEQEFEMARRFVRIAGSAARQAACAGASADPRGAARSAVIGAARRHLPRLGGAGQGGRWVRRGNQIVVVGL
jgi:hypothetical protein